MKKKLNYLVDKLKRRNYEKNNSSLPWLNKNANIALESLIRPNDVVLECGSGRSTQWFSKNSSKVISIEHDKNWYEKIKNTLVEQNLKNVEYHFVHYNYDIDQKNNEYVKLIESLPEESLDISFVDGGPRSFCALASIPKLKKNGVLIIDDAQIFFPTKSNVFKGFKDEKDIPEKWQNTELNWKEVFNQTKNWRKINTTDGITETLLLIKPC